MTTYTVAQALAAANSSTPLSGAAILDSAADVRANLDALQPLAAAGEIAFVNFTDTTAPTIDVPFAQDQADAAVIGMFEGQRTVHITDATVAETFQIQSQQHVSISVVDSGQAVESNIDAISNIANEIANITITDGTIPSFSASQMVNDSAVIGGITVAGINAAKAVANLAAVQNIHGLAVTDTAADISTYITGLQALATAGKLSSITLTDSGVPSIALSPAELAADGGALGTIQGSSYVVSVDGGTANLSLTAPSGIATVLVLDGSPNQYSLTAAGDGKDFTVTDTSTGRTSTDHLSGFTALQFDNGGTSAATTIFIASATPSAGTVTSADVAALYGAALNREPDVSGLNFYEKFASSNPSVGITQYAADFLSSKEYTGNPAHQYAQTPMGETQFVTDTYNDLLHRAPDSGGVNFYLTNDINPMLANLTPGTAAYAAADLAAHALVVAEFSQSPEFRSDVGITAQNQASASHWLLLV